MIINKLQHLQLQKWIELQTVLLNNLCPSWRQSPVSFVPFRWWYCVWRNTFLTGFYFNEIIENNQFVNANNLSEKDRYTMQCSPSSIFHWLRFKSYLIFDVKHNNFLNHVFFLLQYTECFTNNGNYLNDIKRFKILKRILDLQNSQTHQTHKR